ncbi:hypothetical protein [Streptomyces sp. NBC_01483]|uniref:hypothetical protein n=1 Tax=Streptomyces sp. NBC_01483 TaxID=2903883 RepID=UPI002E315D07|nr:hypothetical protein [Streptomyces sp. NBC_01483]
MITHRYRPRPTEVTALQWTGHNAAQLTDFAKTRFMEVDPEDRTEDPDATAALLESAHEAWAGLKVGDWIVRRNGQFKRFSPEAFADQYESAERPTDDHNAVWLDDDGDLWGEYQTSPPSYGDAILPLRWDSVECSSKQELEDQGVKFLFIGWSK